MVIFKISVFVICVEAIIYLLLYNLHVCTFNYKAPLISFMRIFFSYFFIFFKELDLVLISEEAAFEKKK